MPVTNLLKSHAVSQTWGARDRTFRLPLVELANWRRSFPPPDLQPRRIFDAHITPEGEAQLGPRCRRGEAAGALPAGAGSRLGSHPGTRGPEGRGSTLHPATLKCAWHRGGPSRGLGWTWARLGTMDEPGRSHHPLPPSPASPGPTLISTRGVRAHPRQAGPVGAAEGTREA